MGRSREKGDEPTGEGRREFCRLGGNIVFGLMTLGSLPLSASGIGDDAGSLAPASTQDETGGTAMEDKKVTAVTAKVISVKGECGFGHKPGDTVRISESGVEGKICIHALYSMFPAAFAMLYDVRFPWLQNPDKKTHPCTDAANPVVFELTKIRD